MRRRSASAESTAAVRPVSARVTWAASSASWVGPSRARAIECSADAMPIVIHGAMYTRPTMPTAMASHAPPSCPISKK